MLRQVPGVELRALAADLKLAGITLMLSGLKKQVREALNRAGLDEVIGSDNLFPSKDIALKTLAECYDTQPA